MAGETQESPGIANGPGQDHVRLDWRAPILHATAHDLHVTESQLADCLAEEISAAAASLDEGHPGRGESDGEGYSRESGTGPHVDNIVMRHGPHGRTQRQCSNDVALRKMWKVLWRHEVDPRRPLGDEGCIASQALPSNRALADGHLGENDSQESCQVGGLGGGRIGPESDHQSRLFHVEQ